MYYAYGLLQLTGYYYFFPGFSFWEYSEVLLEVFNIDVSWIKALLFLTCYSFQYPLYKHRFLISFADREQAQQFYHKIKT